MAGPDSTALDAGFVYAGRLDELRAKGKTVIRGARCPLLVVCEGERVFAVDNRCPHLGFPLHRGSVEDGIITCHWHHARFDLATGGGFDLWADDLPTAEVQVRDGEVWVRSEAQFADGAAHWRNRLRAGLEHNIDLVIAKAILGLRAQGVPPADLVREAVLFGVRNRDGWGTGLTILTALARVLPGLPDEETYLALYKGCRAVAEDCAGAPARRARQPLDGEGPSLDAQTRRLRRWTEVRHRDGAERTLLTSIAASASPAELAELMLTAVTDRAFADGGHALDFINKAFECLDLIGWEHAAEVLPATVDHLVTARGAEESNAWRHPADLIALCATTVAELRDALTTTRRGTWNGEAALADTILGDDAQAIAAAIVSAVRAGATGSDLGRTVAYAAAVRVARFGTANEHSDWESAHHAFTYANAVHRLLARLDGAGRPLTADALRGVLHGAMRVYLLRFLNVPPARIPVANGAAPVPERNFLAALDRHGGVDDVAAIVASWPDDTALRTALVRAVLREDAGFHVYQMLEAALTQAGERSDGAPSRHLLIAAARYIAAHTPTPRAELQTANVARKLAGGRQLHDEEEAEIPA
jgi:nitrite reductase/ring-hydroxylating ferredoxin subunit